MSDEDDPVHPILPEPYHWGLREFTFRREADWRETHIDLTFERDGVVRRLRFYAPQDLELPGGLPTAVGMVILDVSGRQLEGIGVRVANVEPTSNVPTFWAARVVDLDDTDQPDTAHPPRYE